VLSSLLDLSLKYQQPIRLWLVWAKNDWTQAEMAGGESKSGSKKPRKITSKPMMTLTGHGGAEHAIKVIKTNTLKSGSRNQTASSNSRRLEGAEMGIDETMREPRSFAMSKATEQICWTQVGTDLGLIRPRRIRPMPNRSHRTKAKSEKAHIEDEEMLDVAEVHYMCFGEFLSFLLICELSELFLLEKKYPRFELGMWLDEAETWPR
jgi:hypothetical protein